MLEINRSISVVLSVYNGMKYLQQSIDSVLQQTFTEFEFLICDDCSVDNSYDFLRTYSDPRIRLYKNSENLGLFPTLNFLCKSANGTIIKLWSQDDIMNPSCLQEVQQFHNEHPEISFSYSDRTIIDEHNNIIPSSFKDNTPAIISPLLHDQIAFFGGSIAGNIANVAIVKEKLQQAGWFDESMKICADFDMWVKLTTHNSIGRIAKNLIQLRNHSGQLSRSSKHYILHLQEDKEVYNLLMQRTSPENKPFSLWVLRHTKYVYYYSLMVRMLINRDFKSAGLFLKELSKMDSIISLTSRWLKKKVFKQDLLKGYHPVKVYHLVK